MDLENYAHLDLCHDALFMDCVSVLRSSFQRTHFLLLVCTGDVCSCSQEEEIPRRRQGRPKEDC